MALRVYLRSPVAIAWTLLGALAVGSVFVVGWLAVVVARSSAVGAHPLFLGGLDELVYLFAVFLLIGLLAVVWLPFGAGVAYAVGRQARGGRASFRESVSAVLDSRRNLLRWLKTRIAVGPLADRLLSEEDVAPNEVVAGCEKFVVPALVLDSPTALPRAVERANRVTPPPGHERLLFGSLSVAGLVAAGVFFAGAAASGSLATVATPLAIGLALLGAVVTAALDATWRAKTYASEDLSQGFLE